MDRSKMYTPAPLKFKSKDKLSSIRKESKSTVKPAARGLDATLAHSSHSFAVPAVPLKGKPKPATRESAADDINELEIDFTYNSYLKALMKKQIVGKTVNEQRAILDGQINYQQEKLDEEEAKRENLEFQMSSLEIQGQIIEQLKCIIENLNELGVVHKSENLSEHLERVVTLLKQECDKVILKNIKRITNSEEFEKFSDALLQLSRSTEKIVNSGRDFEGVQIVAEKIRRYMDKRNTLRQQQKEDYEMQKAMFYELLEKLSDFIANRN